MGGFELHFLVMNTPQTTRNKCHFLFPVQVSVHIYVRTSKPETDLPGWAIATAVKTSSIPNSSIAAIVLGMKMDMWFLCPEQISHFMLAHNIRLVTINLIIHIKQGLDVNVFTHGCMWVFHYFGSL